MIDFTRKQIILASTVAAAAVAVGALIFVGVRANSEEAEEEKQRQEDLKHRAHVNNKWSALKQKIADEKDLKKSEISKMAKDLHAELGEYITKATFHSETRRDQLYHHNADKLADYV